MYVCDAKSMASNAEERTEWEEIEQKHFGICRDESADKAEEQRVRDWLYIIINV